MSIKYSGLKIFLLLTVFVAELYASDYLIIEKPQNFEILDRYQLKLSSGDKYKLPSFLPFKIINENTVLSDGFTQCMELEYKNRQYFIKLNEEGKFLATPDPGYTLHIKNSQDVGDSVFINKDRAALSRYIPFSENNSQYKREYLKKGTALKRLFKYKSDFYAYNITDKSYSWIRITGVLDKPNTNKNEGETVIPDFIYQQISDKIENANELYANLFDHLNKEYNEQKSVPFWSVEKKDNSLVIRLENIINPDKFSVSTGYFISEIETIINTTDLTLQKQDRAFVISGN